MNKNCPFSWNVLAVGPFMECHTISTIICKFFPISSTVKLLSDTRVPWSNWFLQKKIQKRLQRYAKILNRPTVVPTRWPSLNKNTHPDPNPNNLTFSSWPFNFPPVASQMRVMAAMDELCEIDKWHGCTTVGNTVKNIFPNNAWNITQNIWM